MPFERWPTLSGGSGYMTSATTSASANTKGSYTVITAATGIDSSNWCVQTSLVTTLRSALIDIAIGAAASEVIQVENLVNEAQHNPSVLTDGLWNFTSDIASGTRVAVRGQGSGGSTGINVILYLTQSTLAGRALAITYGAITSTSRGTTVDPGGTVNVEGAYSQITAATSATHTQINIGAIKGSSSVNFSLHATDFATGAAASETVILPNIYHVTDNVCRMALPRVFPITVTIASGTRIAMRMQADWNVLAERTLDFVVYGFETLTSSGSGGEHSAVF